MPRKRHTTLRALADEVARTHPWLANPKQTVAAGDVRVDGIVRTNPASLVRVGSSIVVGAPAALRGEGKLEAALAAFEVPVAGRVALDVGAAAGGFTRVLLRAGARRVYAVDAGHGQLLGSLRQDARVVDLERTNIGDLDTELVPEPVEVVAIDVSYLPLRQAIPQLERVAIAGGADAVALVKPQFELGLARLPESEAQFVDAVRSVRHAFEATGWDVRRTIRSPLTGARGAVEFLMHARRA